MQVHDVFKTKSLTHTFMASRTKQRVAEGIDILLPFSEELEDCSFQQNVGSYLTLLFTLLLAYARAGAKPLEQNPPVTEGRGSDTTLFVEVPLDWVLRYHSRAQAKVAQLPSRLALSWLQERDIAERTLWVELHRNGPKTKSLGQVIKEAHLRREAQWDIPVNFGVEQASGSSSSNVSIASNSPPTSGSNNNKSGKTDSPRILTQSSRTKATHLRNGTKICPAFNAGGCDKRNCQLFHGCNRVISNGRVCGLRNHTSDQCRVR